jgi:cystathionine beta-lyase family protein involved in aluminum resistance
LGRAWWLPERQEALLAGRAASVMKAMMRLLAPQLGQTSGSGANSRASSIAHR